MSGLAQKITWGVAGMAATRAARTATRRALHNDRGANRLPRAARRKNGFATALFWAAGAGLLLGVSDILREQRSDVTERS
jgi:hypothetical protein